MNVITNLSEWRTALAGFGDVDSYFSCDYHRIETQKSGAEPHLFVYELGSSRVAVPLVVRAIEGSELRDATSVYGYAGPLLNGDPVDERRFASALRDALDSIGVVSVFSRLHPLLEQTELISSLGDIVAAGNTVSVDLTLPEDQQWSQYRKNLRREVRALRESEIEVYPSSNDDDIAAFTSIYNATMKRRDAGSEYLVSVAEVKELLAAKDFTTYLFVCKLDGTMICAGLFMHCGEIIQYHLSGTDERYQRMAPTKLLLDSVRLWAVEQGATIFHLGGGVGGGEDSLFRFKKGFSNRQHDFSVWKWVVDQSKYDQLCKSRDETFGSVEKTTFFPYYRAPQHST